MKSLNSLSLYPNGYWVVNLFVLLCYCQDIEESCDEEYIKNKGLPEDWPCDWNNGTIPFAFNFFSQSPKRLIGLVKKGHDHLEKISCLRFKEHNPVTLAHTPNITYLYYTYSGVLESCCLELYTKSVGRRLVLITPMCTVGLEVAHVILHGMGLWHPRQRPFAEAQARPVLFPTQCKNAAEKLKSYDLGRK
ncbi:zinc metalloproteinase nas-26-like [Amyelois transitella]|uniref:zinc metalloproteinase nas-26-like n=1 Tax=Amyelois transitella TaxID=680683 RepID=UPI00067D4888|nr:zinc metalloproteinase nas-26-like [Amyelois transitella]